MNSRMSSRRSTRINTMKTQQNEELIEKETKCKCGQWIRENKSVKCGYCDIYFCIKCMDVSEHQQQVIANCKAIHWFCEVCEMKAIASIQTEKDIEARCAQYMKKMEERMSELEKGLKLKVDRSEIETIVKKYNESSDQR